MDLHLSTPRKLGVFTLSMVSISAIIALRNLPTLAKNGPAIIIILSLAAILFFIPVALTCAELASGWSQSGGLYAWVKAAFGNKVAALAIWLEWIESVVWLPTVLSFIASSIAYIINPALIEHRYFMFFVMMGILWSGTLVNFLSLRTSSWISTFGIIAGSILPGIGIIGLGALWYFSGQPIHVTFDKASLLPDFTSVRSFAYFTAIALGFAGIEVAAFYVQDTHNPKRTFPRATFIAAAIIIAIYVLGALSIALVIPKEDLNLSAGMMQAMNEFFTFLNIPWATSLFAFFSVIGGLALLNTWLIGPSKGLLSSALDGDLPAFTRKTNKNGSPVAILLMQAILGTGLISMNLFIPTINQFYWIFQTQAAQLILLMYLLIFCSVIKLRYSQPDVPRLFSLPGGKIGLWIIAGSGILFCIAAFLLGFLPPEEYQFIKPTTYTAILAGGIILFCAPSILWNFFRGRTVRA